MKKILTLLFIICLTTSCSSDFLEIYPQTSLNEGNFYNSEKEYILLVNGCYTQMRNFYKREAVLIGEMQSDNTSYMFNATDGGQPAMEEIEKFFVTINNSTYAGFWKTYYNAIYGCNKLIDALDKSSIKWETQEIKERCYGEAYFLRAFYYFDLVRNFAGVPLVTEPIASQEAYNYKRASEEDVYQLIVSDLNASVAHFENARDVEENGRANYGSALALLGRVYLNMKSYKDVIETLQQLVNLNKYNLLPNYADLFNPSKKDFKETIFSVQYSEENATLANSFLFIFVPHTSKGEITHHPNIVISGGSCGWNQPTNDLIEAFEPGDKRFDESIKFWNGPDWDGTKRDIPYCAKFKEPIASVNRWCSDNFPILRYSDVLLMLAEAYNELSQTDKALPYVEQVRARAGLEMPANLDQTSLRTLILNERRVEFCFENQRWYDLKRTGNALKVMREHGQREKSLKSWLPETAYNVEEYMLTAPIPAVQVEINGFEQNPGY